MANVVITSSTNSIKVVFNVYSSDLIPEKEAWHKNSTHFKLMDGNAYVKATEDNGTDLDFSWNGSTGTMQVDSVDGVAPTINSDLYDKLIALIA